MASKKDMKPRGQRPAGELKSKPMANQLKDVRVGPDCLECKGPIDSRPGWSVDYLKGSRKHQRNGYLHMDCEEKAMARLAETQGKKYLDVRPGKAPLVQPGVKLALPVFSDEDLADILEGKDNSA